MIVTGRDEGLSEVVGFILILGLLVIAVAAYQIYEVPAIGRNDEIDHMNYIKDRFVDYKISVDSLWINSIEKENYYDPIKGVTLSTSLNLGTMGGIVSGGDDIIPILTPIPSAGSLTIDGSSGEVYISADGVDIANTSLGVLSYSSNNNYWVNQEYYYQMGGVFLRQPGGGTAIRVDPPLSIYNSGGYAAIQITPVSIFGDQMIAGSGPVKIETRLRASPQYLSNTMAASSVILEFRFDNAADADVWARVINNALEREGTYGWCPGYPVEAVGNTVTAEIDPGGLNNVRLDIYRADYAVWFQNVATDIE